MGSPTSATASLLARRLGSEMPTIPLMQILFEIDRDHFTPEVLRNPDYGWLYSYHLDLWLIEDTEPGLFRWMLPWSIAAWRDSLFDNDYGAGDATEELETVFEKRPGLIAEILGDQAAAVVEEVVLDILAEFVRERTELTGPALHWVSPWLMMAAGLPNLRGSWWARLKKGESLGAATAFLQYVTRIAYPSLENPIFPPEDPHRQRRSGEPWHAPPNWPDDQVDEFLREASAEKVQQVLSGFDPTLWGDDAEMVELLIDDFPRQAGLYETRLREVAAKLAGRDYSTEWRDLYGAVDPAD